MDYKFQGLPSSNLFPLARPHVSKILKPHKAGDQRFKYISLWQTSYMQTISKYIFSHFE